MKILRLVSILAFAAGMVTSFPAAAAETLTADQGSDLVLKGDAKCTACHDESDNPQLLQIGKGKHGTRADGRTPTCTSCHGASDAHADSKTQQRPAPDRTFTKNSKTPVADRNDACLSCHDKDAKRSHWAGSIHDARDVACTSCHQVHTGHDKVRDKRTQPEVCYACHKEQRGQVNRPSHHPIPEGKMACSDCHNPHGSVGPKLLKRDSVNDTCYTCHMEKRGPFVHNHEPVSEDCTLCHNPHGTTAENMLKARPPFLCHQCHTPHGGFIPQVTGAQATAPTASTPGKSGAWVTQGRACNNCHTQVHGSNNPTVTNPTPQFMFR
ncbi:DmsE family decaheme c-type cytochrome [Pseudoduganella sp. FT25W]|uniref:DmsE family decaheme c-type cytochrome n=1 Tax=Duganella alba TaxID=2666081 RepID=A0A6L5QL69_9BURK|nr:DmsE family decaheme c-type cytochrome [Duganella alba]MRX10546.1 DmsE family decaheme c-type cytochrome [Duganella alba]MRX18166.1 DmsE family decaheme c-type cytochrome [Duganella alba]